MKQLKNRWIAAAALLLCAVPATASATHLSAYNPLPSPDSVSRARLAYRIGLQAYLYGRPLVQAYQAQSAQGAAAIFSSAAPISSGCELTAWAAGQATAPVVGGKATGAVPQRPAAAGKGAASDIGQEQALGKGAASDIGQEQALGKGAASDIGQEQALGKGAPREVAEEQSFSEVAESGAPGKGAQPIGGQESRGAQPIGGQESKGAQPIGGQESKGGPLPAPSLHAQPQLGLPDDACLSSAPPADLGVVGMWAPMDQLPLQFFPLMNQALGATPPPPEHQALLDAFTQIGVGPGMTFPAEQLDEATRQGLARAVVDGEQLIRQIASTGQRW